MSQASPGRNLGGRPKGALAKINAKQSETAREPGRYRADDNLFLSVSPTGSRSWLFIYSIDGKRREQGLGRYPEISLARARELATELRSRLNEGGDPLREKREAARKKAAEQARPNFGAFAETFIQGYVKSLKSPRQREQWLSSIRVYAKDLYSRELDDITPLDVKEVLDPIWFAKPETARRVRARLEMIFAAALLEGRRTGNNPASLASGLKTAWANAKKKAVRHHPALHYAQVPAFYQSLSDNRSPSAAALRFLILTACRSNEVLGARWSEIDFDAALWTIGSDRMKAGREHRVPLTPAALQILRERLSQRVSTSPNEPIFGGQRPMQPLSAMALAMLVRRTGISGRPHGFRSSFRDWAGDATGHPREVAEQALAHVAGDRTEQAYRRSDALEKRRALMSDWSDFLTSPAPSAQVLPMRAPAK